MRLEASELGDNHPQEYSVYTAARWAGILEKEAASAGNDSFGSPGCSREQNLASAGSLLEKKSRLW